VSLFPQRQLLTSLQLAPHAPRMTHITAFASSWKRKSVHAKIAIVKHDPDRMM
jgi:hypothetical protein